VFVAALQALVLLNQWPLMWMGYDTAVSASTFSMQILVQAMVTLLGLGILLTVSFMAAESLSRKAFPHHIQLWKTWSVDVAGSKPVAGMTVAGFLLVGVFFAYDVALYLFANAELGWWNPSFALYDPDVLATFVPWLSPVAISLQAGFWEECLFRAIPLASAALLGQRFGGKKWWILGALVLQAVIFGAAHANYPAQPAYARLVELIVPAIGFGLLYLVFGLLPAIVLHFAFDVVWFSLPLFAANTPGIWFDRSVVILLTLIPLWVVLNGRRKIGEWSEPPAEARNAAFSPQERREDDPEVERAPRAAGLASQAQVVLVVLGAVGLVAWLVAADFSGDTPRVTIDRGDAVSIARAELAQRELDVPEGWKEMSTVVGGLNLADRFVWNEGGRGAYDGLMGSYLSPPRWLVRYATFEGDVVDRAEEFKVWVGPSGDVRRIAHRVPESREGDALDEEVARRYAQSVVEDLFGLSTDRLREVSAEPERQPNRTDWKFVFADDVSFPLPEGEARIAVHIAGDEIVDGYRFVYIPEEWERAERDRAGTRWLIGAVSTVLMVVVFIAGLVVAIVRWSRGRFAARSFWVSFSLLTGLGVIGLANGWPIIEAQFSTAQPYGLQSIMVIAGGVLATVALATGVALCVGLVHRWVPPQHVGLGVFEVMAGTGVGVAIAGLVAVASRVLPPAQPFWPSFDSAAALLPMTATALDPISGWVVATVFVLLVYAMVDAVSRGWSQKRFVMTGALLLTGLVVAGADGVETTPRWLAEGVLTGTVFAVAYVAVFRRQMALVPLVAAAMSATWVIREGVIGAYPGALGGSIVAGILLLVLGVGWMALMTRESAAGGD
jgi:membrane protease YdiL (CAAX protease family)